MLAAIKRASGWKDLKSLATVSVVIKLGLARPWVEAQHDEEARVRESKQMESAKEGPEFASGNV
jgi:hypothetical protein